MISVVELSVFFFAPFNPDPDERLCLRSLCRTQTHLDHLHLINKGNKPATSLLRFGLSRRLCPHQAKKKKMGFPPVLGLLHWVSTDGRLNGIMGVLWPRCPFISVFVRGKIRGGFRISLQLSV